MKAIPDNLLRLGVVLAAILLLHGAPAVADELDSIVAVIGDEVLLSSELADATKQIKAQWGSSAEDRDLPPDDVLRRQVLERLVLVKLQLARAKSAGIQVSEDDLQQALTAIAARNKMSLNEFSDAVARDGVDYAQLREQIRNEILITKLRQKEVESRVVVSDQDVDLYLQGKDAQATSENEYRLSHILISLNEDATADQQQAARKKAEEVLASLRKGGDFALAAATYSGDQQALNGGDLGWRNAAGLPTLFAKITLRMKPGDISDIITDASGFHIIKLEGIRQGDSDKLVNETHARHILLTPNAVRDDTATKALADKLRKQLDEGADFAALAKSQSDDPGSANQGGDLGWQQVGTFVKPFQDELDSMKPGDIHGPFKSQFGWHIVQLIDRRERKTGKDYVRDRARSAIFQRKVAEEYDQWLRRLRDEAYVEYRSASDAIGSNDDGKSDAASTPPAGG